MNRLAAPLTVVVLSLALSACGGDDAPSKAEFASEAEKICRDAEKQLAGLGEEASGAAEIADVVGKVIDETRRSVDRLEDLERPDGEAGEQAERFVNAVQSDIEGKGIPALEDVRDALEDNDQDAARKAAERLQTLETPDSNRLAREIGAGACAN
jgi:hypothetical protein